LSGVFCTAAKLHRGRWLVVQRNCNHSAFSGYRLTWSAWSAVWCPVCRSIWRTKAGYVASLPDAPANWFEK
jgi:hypothetical protein